jgi:serine/threonine-protein kinase
MSHDFLKVLDFGLVKSLLAPVDTVTDLSQGAITGTPAYMAPEMVEARANIDGRADLYALGCVAYWLLTGSSVFPNAASAVATMLAHVQEPPQPPSAHVPVPADLEAAILRCLEKDPGRRPQSAMELDAQLAACKDAPEWDRSRAADWWNRRFTLETRV